MSATPRPYEEQFSIRVGRGRGRGKGKGKGLLGYRGWNLVPANSSLVPHLTPVTPSRSYRHGENTYSTTPSTPGPRLVSLTWVEFWDNRPKTAICYRQDFNHLPLCTQVPGSNCMCGYWMTETLEELHLHTDRYRFGTNLHMEVAGLVQAWGRCIRHDSGVRCQHMRIVALLGQTSPLWVGRDEGELGKSELGKLGREFDIPVLPTLEELVRFKSDWEAR